MNLDFNNPAVQVAVIAAVATIVTAFVSSVSALITALVSLFNHLFEARTKRSEKVKDIRSEKAQFLLEGVAELHSNVLYYLHLIQSLRVDYLLLLHRLEEAPQGKEAPQGEREGQFSAFMKDASTRIEKYKAIEEEMINELRKVTHYFTPKLVSSLFWFPQPLRFKGKLEKLVEECRAVYIMLSVEIGEVYELEKKMGQSSYITEEVRKMLLEKGENELLKDWKDKTFKTVVTVQRLLAPYVR